MAKCNTVKCASATKHNVGIGYHIQIKLKIYAYPNAIAKERPQAQHAVLSKEVAKFEVSPLTLRIFIDIRPFYPLG